MTNNNCTIVSAFYDSSIKKHTSKEYKEWISYFLPNANSPMVIFTDENSFDIIYEARKNHENKTKIIVLPVHDFYTHKYINHWKKDVNRDHEILNGTQHSIELYMIWNEKPMFVKRAMDINPFRTEFFCWTDIGIVRKEEYSEYIKYFPKITDKINSHKVYMLNIQNLFDSYDFEFEDIASEKYRYKNYIGAGVILGHINVMSVWIAKYYITLNEFVEKDLFAGKEQSIMACVYVKNKDIIELIQPKPSPFNDDWFYLLYYFSQ